MKKIWTTKQLLNKAAITSGSFTSGFGLSQVEADRFLDFVIDESQMFPVVRTVRFNAKEFKENKLNLGSEKNLVPGRTYNDSDDIVGIGTEQISLITEEMLTTVFIRDDALEDNVEGDEFADHLMRMVSDAIRNQLEDWAWYARLDPNVGTGSEADYLKDILQLKDGWLERLEDEGATIVDADGAGFADRFIARDKLRQMVRKMPTKFRRNKGLLRFMMHEDLRGDYEDLLAERETAQGDRAQEGVDEPKFSGVEFMSMGLVRTNRPVAVAAGGAGELASGAVAGAASVTLDTIAGYNVADKITIGFGGPREETLTIGALPGANVVDFGGGETLNFKHDAAELCREVLENGTDLILSDPRNLIYGISRDITIEPERKAKRRGTEWVISMRKDTNIEKAEAAVVGKNFLIKE